MNPVFNIAGRLIGLDHPPLVIAELGINHGGSLNVAKEMVDAACRAGVEVLKHQTHIVADEMSAAAKKVIPGNADISIYEIMEQSALDTDQEYELKQYVESKGMIFISTPFSRTAADRLQEFDIPAFKIGSGECNNYPLIEHIARFGKPMIISTGMNTIESVRRTVEICKNHKVPLALMHTTNLYPTPPELVRYGGFQALQKHFPELVVGLSDHTVNNNACLGAVALGASIIERHFTDQMNRQGPDIVCSMDEIACAALINGAKEIALMRGGEKVPAKEEQVTIDFAFATVCTIKPVRKGELLSNENIWVKRPGTGPILAAEFDELIGKTASRNLPMDHHLDYCDFE